MKHTLRTLILLCGLFIFSQTLVAQVTTPTLTKEPTSGPYKVGDYYNEGGLEGVVFQVSEDGTSGKIVNLSQSRGVRQWASTNEGTNRLLGAMDMDNGLANCRLITQLDGWKEKFPAIAWCVAQGKGWHLPAINELREFILNPTTSRLVNNTLKALGATPIPGRSEMVDFWSSTERDFCYTSGKYCAWGVNSKGGVSNDNGKSLYAKVRAIATFPIEEVEVEDGALTATTSAPYKVGDYYNNGTLRGVVFHINEDGTHGKIVSMAQSGEDLLWSLGEEQKRVIGATDRKCGKNNMTKVMSIENWQNLYPAFAWCAKLGDGWYLPAIEEVELLMQEETHAKVNATLDTFLATPLHTLHPVFPQEKWEDYWTSTESEELYTPDEEYEGEVCAYALGYFIINSTEYQVTKRNDSTVRAVAEF